VGTEDEDVFEEVETVVLGVVAAVEGIEYATDEEWENLFDWTRFTEGDWSCTYTLRLRGVVEGTGVRTVD
jgi:hypothetical protein